MVNQLEDLIGASRVELLEFMKIEDPGDEDYKRARAIQGIYASATRELQTRGAQEAARYGMAQDFLTPDERADYVRLAMPDHAAIKVREARKELTAGA